MELDAAVQNTVKKLEGEDVDMFEVFGMSKSSLSIEAKRQMIHMYRRSTSRGIAVRVVADGRIGWSATTDISAKEVAKTVSHAIASLKVSSSSDEAVIVKPQEPEGGFYERVGRSYSEISDDEKMQMALKLESEAIASDKRLARVRSPIYEEETVQFSIVNSNGVFLNAKRGLVSAMLLAIATEEGVSESEFDFVFTPRFEDLDVQSIARNAAERAVAKLGATSMEGGQYPVIFENRAASSMLKILSPSFFADNVQRSKSRLAGQVGEEVYSPLVTIIDDGLLPDGFGSFAFDGEGVPSQRNILVSSGKINSFLYDGPRANKDGVPSTGNCMRADVNDIPSIGVTNFFLKAGTTKAGDLMSDVSKGLFVTNLLGIHTANPISGDFSFGAEGFLIKDGRKDRPVRGVTIAGNTHDLFKDIVAVADDLTFRSQCGSPSFRVDGLMVAS
ncbi:MAG: TldD/PmbA family protein [Deltaproteobacteria bacterium]|nr:TldD/PmbA family protein [Deltaproteobacteria bacterium]